MESFLIRRGGSESEVEFGPVGRAASVVDAGVWGRGMDEGSGDLGVAAMVLGRLARGELGREGGRCVDVGELGPGGVAGIIRILSVYVFRESRCNLTTLQMYPYCFGESVKYELALATSHSVTLKAAGGPLKFWMEICRDIYCLCCADDGTERIAATYRAYVFHMIGLNLLKSNLHHSGIYSWNTLAD